MSDEIGYIKSKEITEEIKESYLAYAMSVIVTRALPDVRDGLKPVHRRILFAMNDMSLRHNAKYRKSASVVGEVLGKYHPHGDMAVYDSMVRMAQDFALRYMLVDGQGNFGSIDGDSAAAPRYTEARMSKIGEETLREIEKETVDFRDNYDGTRKEPTVLPSPLPQLLLNGSFGIAVGMATSIPPHNSTELLDACIHLIDNPESDTEELFQFVGGPDFPTGGIIYGRKDILAAYNVGKGPIICRGKADIKEGKKGIQIIITEIPYQVQKSDLVQDIARIVENKKVEGIRNVTDESDREGMRIVIDLKKEAFPKKILNALYKFTPLQKTFHLNMLALVDNIQPKVLSLSDALSYYINHRVEVVTRKIKYDLKKAKERAHILEGLMIALNNIDDVIETIKKSASRDDAKQNLIKKFKLSELQAVAILEMRLQNLAKLERDKIDNELKELQKLISGFEVILKSEKKIRGEVKKDFEAMKEKYGDKRRTKVIATKPGEIGEEELIPNTEAIITVTDGGYIKRVKPALYKTQKRGGKGIMGLEVQDEDRVDHFLMANNLDKMLFFADSGKAFQTLVWEIPELNRTSKGRGLLNFLELSSDEKVLSLLTYNKEDEKKEKYLVMVTKNGIIKKTPLTAFKNVRRNGLIAIKLNNGDLLKSVKLVEKDQEIILVTRKGKSIRFSEKDIRSMGRGAAGVRGIKIGSDDEVIGMDIVDGTHLLLIAENGYGKRTKLDQYRSQKRGGTGIKAANITSKTGDAVYFRVLNDQKELIIISKKGQVIRTELSSISIIGRVSSGVRVMKLKGKDTIASAITI